MNTVKTKPFWTSKLNLVGLGTVLLPWLEGVQSTVQVEPDWAFQGLGILIILLRTFATSQAVSLTGGSRLVPVLAALVLAGCDSPVTRPDVPVLLLTARLADGTVFQSYGNYKKYKLSGGDVFAQVVPKGCPVSAWQPPNLLIGCPYYTGELLHNPMAEIGPLTQPGVQGKRLAAEATVVAYLGYAGVYRLQLVFYDRNMQKLGTVDGTDLFSLPNCLPAPNCSGLVREKRLNISAQPPAGTVVVELLSVNANVAAEIATWVGALRLPVLRVAQ